MNLFVKIYMKRHDRHINTLWTTDFFNSVFCLVSCSSKNQVPYFILNKVVTDSNLTRLLLGGGGGTHLGRNLSQALRHRFFFFSLIKLQLVWISTTFLDTSFLKTINWKCRAMKSFLGWVTLLPAYQCIDNFISYSYTSNTQITVFLSNFTQNKSFNMLDISTIVKFPSGFSR